LAQTRRIRVLVADDHPMLREGVVARITAQPDMELAGEAADGVEALNLFRIHKPDVTLIDLLMPNGPGLPAIKAMREEDPRARIIVLTTYEGDVHARMALRAGASGYLLKTAVRRELLDTIRNVHAGRSHVEPRIAQEIALRYPQELLSERELSILRLASDGQANKEIGRLLCLTEGTVKSYMKDIFVKLGVSDRTHAVTVAIKRGLIEI
jgi:DNA-binding NarL/FixJ family response regulator